VTAWRGGIDTGGTFADVVSHDPGSGRLSFAKLPRSAGTDALAAALPRLGVQPGATVVHGTTHVTNAILEGRMARTALVTTAGFGDVLEIGRQAREDLYDLTVPARTPPVVERGLVVEARERLDHDGAILVPLDGAEIRRVAGRLRELDVEAVAVSLLHAYANGAHEARLGEAIDSAWPVSLSHLVAAEAREYERAASTALNAAVLGGTAAYLDALEAAVARQVPDARLFVVLSSGSMVPLAAVRALPLATVMSGPAAGVAASARLARRLRIERAVTFDMGGTSTDVALLLDGEVATARERKVGGHVVRLPAAAVESIAIGGGSLVAVDDVGALTVGPRSAGGDPGPACYGRGGSAPTVTDACVVCGLIHPDDVVGGLRLDPDLAHRALEPAARALGLSLADTAWQVVAVAQVQMERALRAVAVRRGYDLRTCELVAYGGGGPVHAGPLAARAGIRRVLVPRLASVFSAVGCCLAEAGVEAVRTVRATLAGAVLEELRPALAELAERDLARLDGAAGGPVEVHRRLELRYRRQNAALSVPWASGDGPAELAERFHAAHQREYGFTVDDAVEVTAIVARTAMTDEAAWPAAAPSTASPRAERALVLPGGARRAVPVVGMQELEHGTRVHGHAFVAAPSGTVTVWEGQVASADADGNVVVEAT
jgi:N-methylhydantoinase A